MDVLPLASLSSDFPRFDENYFSCGQVAHLQLITYNNGEIMGLGVWQIWVPNYDCKQDG